MTTIRRKIEEYPEEFYSCRQRRHQWDEKGIYRSRQDGEIFIVIRYVCLTCEAVRDDYFTKNGEFIGADRTYAKGYLVRYTPEDKENGVRITGREIARYRILNAKRLGALPD